LDEKGFELLKIFVRSNVGRSRVQATVGGEHG
jgi:hypothetical protein